jgi:hypothetical protein
VRDGKGLAVDGGTRLQPRKRPHFIWLFSFPGASQGYIGNKLMMKKEVNEYFTLTHDENKK